MSKHDLESKLKARLDEWQAYGDKPIIPPWQEQAVHEQEGIGLPIQPQTESFALVHVKHELEAQAPEEVLFEAQEQQIAALKEALDQEREKSRRLLGIVADQKERQGVTLPSEKPRMTVTRGGAGLKARKPTSQRATYPVDPRLTRDNYWVLIVVVLVIAVGCTFLAYAFVP